MNVYEVTVADCGEIECNSFYNSDEALDFAFYMRSLGYDVSIDVFNDGEVIL